MTILKNAGIGIGIALAAIIILMGAFLTATREQLVVVEAQNLEPEPVNQGCLTPVNWYPYVIQTAENVSTLAAAVGASESAILTANCIDSDLEVGTLIYLPALPESAGLANCGPSAGWLLYEVQANESLEQLSVRFGTSAWRLRTANCLVDATLLREGLKIFAPITPTASPTLLPSNTPTPTTESTPALELSPTP